MDLFTSEELRNIILQGWVIKDMKDIKYGNSFYKLHDMNTNMFYDPLIGWTHQGGSKHWVFPIKEDRTVAGNLAIFDINSRDQGFVYFFSLASKENDVGWELRGFYLYERDMASGYLKSAYYLTTEDTPRRTNRAKLLSRAFENSNEKQMQGVLVNRNLKGLSLAMLDAFTSSIGYEANLRKKRAIDKRDDLFNRLNGGNFSLEELDRLLWSHEQILKNSSGEGFAFLKFSNYGCHYALTDLLFEKNLSILKGSDLTDKNVEYFLNKMPIFSLEDCELITIEKTFKIVMEFKNEFEIDNFAKDISFIIKNSETPICKYINDKYKLLNSKAA